jgi:hypothetical protein
MAEDTAARSVVERERIAQVINRLFVATDARDWEEVRACFAGEVAFDMTSVAGGAPARLSPSQITAGWDSGLRFLDSIHHQTGNLAIQCQEKEATASCYGIAYHYRRTASGRNTRVFVGSYDFHLALGEQWKIDLFRFNLKFIDGNLDLDREPSL